MPMSPDVAMYISNHSVGCRFGTTAENAAYAFGDIEGGGQDGHDPQPSVQTVLAWLRDPNAAAFEPRWDDRLWNTCGVIVGHSASGAVCLVSRATGTAERYLFDATRGKGDGYSFRKCNALQPGSEILWRIDYGSIRRESEHDDTTTATPAGSVLTIADLNGKIVEALALLARGARE